MQIANVQGLAALFLPFFKCIKGMKRISPKGFLCYTLALSTTAERHSSTRPSLQKLLHCDGIFRFELGWTKLEQITKPP